MRSPQLVTSMNTAKTIDEVCDRHGLDKAAWTVDSNGRKLVLRAAGFNIDDSEDVVKAKFGPPKGSARALVKLQEAKKEEEKGGKKGTGLKDLNRISLEFHDPLVMALMFECLKNHKTIKIVTVKNKFKLKAGKTKFEQPPDLHVNVDIGDGWLCEVQVRRERTKRERALLTRPFARSSCSRTSCSSRRSCTSSTT